MICTKTKNIFFKNNLPSLPKANKKLQPVLDKLAQIPELQKKIALYDDMKAYKECIWCKHCRW